MPRFAGPATMMRLPSATSAKAATPGRLATHIHQIKHSFTAFRSVVGYRYGVSGLESERSGVDHGSDLPSIVFEGIRSDSACPRREIRRTAGIS